MHYSFFYTLTHEQAKSKPQAGAEDGEHFVAPKKRKKRRRVVMGSRSKKARLIRQAKRKQTSSTESSGDEETEEADESSMDTSQSDREVLHVAMATEDVVESIGQRLRVRSRSGSNSEQNVFNKKRSSWTEVSSQEEEEEEEGREGEAMVVVVEVGEDLRTPPLQESLRTKTLSSLKSTNQEGSAIETECKPTVASSPSTVLLPSTPDRTPKKRKRIPYTLVEASKGNHCPTPGCDGLGHLTGMYAMHFAVSGCPKAHGKTPDECRARREELNRLRVKAIPPVSMTTSSSVANGGHSERSARRISRVTGGNPPSSTAVGHGGRSGSYVSQVCSPTLQWSWVG